MKRIAAVTVALCVILAGCRGDPGKPAAKIPKQGPKPGFREMKWGDAPANEMQFNFKNDFGDNYQLPFGSDRGQIGGVYLAWIEYSFFNHRFCKVEIEFLKSQGKDLLIALEGQWGKPAIHPGEKWYWHTVNSDPNDTTAILDLSKGNEGKLTIYQDQVVQPLLDKIAREDEEKWKRRPIAKGDL